MILTYTKYIELLSALDEHCKGKLQKYDLQDAIFFHYIERDKFLVAENINGFKRLFRYYHQNTALNKKEKKLFRNHMNQELNKKRITEKTVVLIRHILFTRVCL